MHYFEFQADNYKQIDHIQIEEESKWEQILDNQNEIYSFQSNRIDVKKETDQASYDEIIKMIRNLIFGSKLINFEASEVGFKFKRFLLNLDDDENSQTEGFQKYLDIDKAYPSAEETLKKR